MTVTELNPPKPRTKKQQLATFHNWNKFLIRAVEVQGQEVAKRLAVGYSHVAMLNLRAAIAELRKLNVQYEEFNKQKLKEGKPLRIV